MDHAYMENIWLFGYGSLIWNPDIPYIDSSPARVNGFVRRFWQGSHDHRGTPQNPGRVVTLVPSKTQHCDGIAYLVSKNNAENVFQKLDHREKNGYAKLSIKLSLINDISKNGVSYIAKETNHAFLGPGPIQSIAEQIFRCSGPSGKNKDYLFELARSLRQYDFIDQHIFELESIVKDLERIS